MVWLREALNNSHLREAPYYGFHFEIRRFFQLFMRTLRKIREKGAITSSDALTGVNNEMKTDNKRTDGINTDRRNWCRLPDIVAQDAQREAGRTGREEPVFPERSVA